MSKFSFARGAGFGRSGLSEAIAEIGLALAAAAFTAALWLSLGAWALAPASPAATRHVTLPTVVIVGRRDATDGTPVTTTAQNTATNPVTLR